MWSSFLLFLAAALLTAHTTAAATNQTGCTSAQRLAGARLIPYAYNLVTANASYAAFNQVPFADDCIVLLNANGLPAIEVANSRSSSISFATTTRQVFSRVTGRYTDYENGTTIIATNVTLGLRNVLPIPFTFSANVYLDYYLTDCKIEVVQAFATIPSQVLGILVSAPQLRTVNVISDGN